MTSAHHKMQLCGMTKRLYLMAPICRIQVALATALFLDGHQLVVRFSLAGMKI